MSKKIEPHVQKLYKIGELVGSGAYGHVWRVQDKQSGKHFALKKIYGAFRNNVDAQRTYREVQILQQMKHPNIIKLIKVIKSVNKEDLYLVFEQMEADLLAVVGSNVLTLSHKKYIFFQLLKGIEYIHRLQLIHRDLKPSNILLNSSCNIKICDFGLVRSLYIPQAQHPILSEQVATKWYRAPELLLGSRNYSYPVDLWSVGCIVAQLLIGKALFTGNSTLEQLEKIMEFTGNISKQDLQSLDSPIAECLIAQIHPKIKYFQQYFSFIDPNYYPLLRGLLKFNPKRRLTAAQALNLELFADLRQQSEEIHQEYLSEPIVLSLNDNFRFNLKEYRRQIFSHISKKSINAKKQFINKDQLSRSSLKHKSLSKAKSSSKKSSKSVIITNSQKIRSLSKNRSAPKNIHHNSLLPKTSPNKIQKIVNYQRISSSDNKKYNPYKQSLKEQILHQKSINKVTKINGNKSLKLKKLSINNRSQIVFKPK